MGYMAFKVTSSRYCTYAMYASMMSNAVNLNIVFSCSAMEDSGGGMHFLNPMGSVFLETNSLVSYPCTFVDHLGYYRLV